MEITMGLLIQKRKEYQKLALKYIDSDPGKYTYNLGKAKAMSELLFVLTEEESLKRGVNEMSKNNESDVMTGGNGNKNTIPMHPRTK